MWVAGKPSLFPSPSDANLGLKVGPWVQYGIMRMTINASLFRYAFVFESAPRCPIQSASDRATFPANPGPKYLGIAVVWRLSAGFTCQ